MFGSNPTHLCTRCGTECRPEKITKGSFIIEIGLWLFFILPGLVYSIWRLATRYHGCPSCKSRDIIDRDSPIGIKLRSGT